MKSATFNPDGTLHQTLEQDWNILQSEYRDTARYTYTYGTATLGAEEKTISSFDIYPNSASHVIHIVFENETTAKIFVSDLQGKLLKTDQAAGTTHSLSRTDLSGGIYLLKVERDGKTEVRRIVKN